MSGANLRATDTSPTRQPRQNRTNSVGLPARSSLFQDPSFSVDNVIPPPLPRRHSATPANVKPPIPKRSRYERPIPVVQPQQSHAQASQSDESTHIRPNWQDSVSGPGVSSYEASLDAEEKALRDRALDQASKDLSKRLRKISGTGNSLRTSRSPKRGDKGQRSPIRRRQLLQQLHPRSGDEDDEDDDDESPSDAKFAEMRAASRRLESRLHELEDSCAASRPEVHTVRGIEKPEKLPKATQTNLPPPLSSIASSIPSPAASATTKPVNARQDSNVSSDSFSQTSSPGYNSKGSMEQPLLPHKQSNGKIPGRAMAPEPAQNPPGSPITKSISTPVNLQTIVRIQNGSNMSLHHRIVKDIRRPSSHYVTRGRLHFRSSQVLLNALAVLLILSGLAVYYKAVEVISGNTTPPLINNTSSTTRSVPLIVDKGNPAPGVCLPVIVSFCQYHKIPYNYTVFPNFMGNFRQRDAQHEIEFFDAVIDVHCYELAALFFCSLFVPMCGPKDGIMIRPCRNLCFETIRRCSFFLDVFGLTIPNYIHCDLFPESPQLNACVGYHEVLEAAKREAKPVCPKGFQCDEKRCIPLDWRCDGHVDCEDHTDEIGCGECSDGERNDLVAISSKGAGRKTSVISQSVKNQVFAPASLHCGGRRCMSATHVCDGIKDCPWAQDERNCLRLSSRNGDIGTGRLEVYHAKKGKFMPACVANWRESLPKEICSRLGYKTVNSSTLLKSESNTSIDRVISTERKHRDPPIQERNRNLLQEFQKCLDEKDYSVVDLICTGYECGRRRNYPDENARPRKRIVGGVESAPGDWPFLAALLGGPEQIFYCAGVLIADQWVLTASHCVGNRSEISGWTIQLGITRRHSHSYLGKKLKVKRVVPHPEYDQGVAHDNDVALFQLAHRVEFHEHLRPACLPSANIDLANKVCTVIGWGKKEDSDNSKYEPAVNEVNVPVVSRETCNSWLLHKELNITDGMICAGYPEGGKDACQGDSGGPLLCQDENEEDRWFVGGIVSWGIKCAHPRLPGVYAYVPKYVPWIQAMIEEYSDSSNNDFG
ncbi:atrial natriuretic peptide-converting enzyme-like [Copidosoma floridanum]|uniref:atrial natriuretic peptide-converting enzyme-like n=1 Tax=Copidosoma floridanum TaxID=29053 RepID=UPI0006C9A7E9|nr:atrial natriuretic peptide-converting enzyme-like [Copidosoma floridanum]